MQFYENPYWVSSKWQSHPGVSQKARHAAVLTVLAGTKIIYGSHHKLHVVKLTPKTTHPDLLDRDRHQFRRSLSHRWLKAVGLAGKHHPALLNVLPGMGWRMRWSLHLAEHSHPCGQRRRTSLSKALLYKKRWCLPTSRSFTGASSDARGAPTIPVIESFVNLLLTLTQNGHHSFFKCLICPTINDLQNGCAVLNSRERSQS